MSIKCALAESGHFAHPPKDSRARRASTDASHTNWHSRRVDIGNHRRTSTLQNLTVNECSARQRTACWRAEKLHQAYPHELALTQRGPVQMYPGASNCCIIQSKMWPHICSTKLGHGDPQPRARRAQIVSAHPRVPSKYRTHVTQRSSTYQSPLRCTGAMTGGTLGTALITKPRGAIGFRIGNFRCGVVPG